ncbi:MAG: TRAP transporter large permease [Defluviitaleaceae bacterium]|nr:TRAP transporter large permease [Defluviitaleaceae bacterium]
MSIGVLFILFLVMLAISLPVAATLGIAAFLPNFVAFFRTGDTTTLMTQLAVLVRNLANGVDAFTLLAIPMFILAGGIMAKGGISNKLFNIFAYFLANKTAGMPSAVILSTLFYSMTSGSGPATVAAVGTMAIPLLVKLGYDIKWSTALIAVTGGIGVVSPPSIPYVLFGAATGTNVGELFIAGIIPSVLIIILLLLYTYIYCKKHGEDKEKLLAYHAEVRENGFWAVFKSSFWAMLAPVIILGSIYTGVAAPTEAAVIAVVYSLFLSVVVYRTLNLNELKDVFVSAINTYATLLFILAAAVAFGRTLILMRAPQQIAEMIMGTFTTYIAIIIVINLFMLFIGTFLDTTPAILILAPLFLPIAVAMGMHPVHFGVMMVINKAIGFVTPPLGVNIFVSSSITGLPMMTIIKHSMVPVITFIIALFLIAFVPWFSLALI